MRDLQLTILCLLFSLILCGAADRVNPNEMFENHVPKIVNGEESVPHAWPFTVAIYLGKFLPSFACGGSILSPYWIVTAAHCVIGWSPNQVHILVGAHDLKDEAEVTQTLVEAAEVIWHEDYNHTLLFKDIALVRLTEPLEFNDAVAPIVIAPELPAAGANATMIGWGRTCGGFFCRTSDVLRQVAGPVADYAECDDYFATGPIDEFQVCVDTTRGGTCSGDSGGPLVLEGQLVGATSFGKASDCSDNLFTAFTGLPGYSDWVCQKSGICPER